MNGRRRSSLEFSAFSAGTWHTRKDPPNQPIPAKPAKPAKPANPANPAKLAKLAKLANSAQTRQIRQTPRLLSHTGTCKLHAKTRLPPVSNFVLSTLLTVPQSRPFSARFSNFLHAIQSQFLVKLIPLPSTPLLLYFPSSRAMGRRPYSQNTARRSFPLTFTLLHLTSISRRGLEAASICRNAMGKRCRSV